MNDDKSKAVVDNDLNDTAADNDEKSVKGKLKNLINIKKLKEAIPHRKPKEAIQEETSMASDNKEPTTEDSNEETSVKGKLKNLIYFKKAKDLDSVKAVIDKANSLLNDANAKIKEMPKDKKVEAGVGAGAGVLGGVLGAGAGMALGVAVLPFLVVGAGVAGPTAYLITHRVYKSKLDKQKKFMYEEAIKSQTEIIEKLKNQKDADQKYIKSLIETNEALIEVIKKLQSDLSYAVVESDEDDQEARA